MGAQVENISKPPARYGVWNMIKKEFQFGINEPSKAKAYKKLFSRIGKDAYKWRFEIRRIRP